MPKTAEADKPLTLEEWTAQKPCGYCFQRPGQNPVTGVHVRSWDQATRSFVEGHRIDCQRPKEKR